MPPPLLPPLIRKPEVKTPEPYIVPQLRDPKEGMSGIKIPKAPSVIVKKVRVPVVKRDHYSIFRDLCADLKVYIEKTNKFLTKPGGDKSDEANYLIQKCN